MTVDVQALGCDFYACSGRKMLGPDGIGVLYARSSLLERMATSPSGRPLTGAAIDAGLFDDLPARFGSRTPPVADIVGLAAAIEYLHSIGFDAIAAYERELLRYATAMLSRISGIRVLGMARQKSGILSFLLDGVAPEDVAMALARERITIRAGDHRCQPLMQRLGVTATARASLAFYNTPADIETLAAALVTMPESR
jgi:cysteine desulfurase/selenocysteine lyase